MMVETDVLRRDSGMPQYLVRRLGIDHPAFVDSHRQAVHTIFH